MHPPPAVADRLAEQAADALYARVPLGLRVLVVDDNRDAADALGAVLDLSGADVRVCYDGPSAVAAAEAFRPQVALLDVHMPGMDGCELARRLDALAGDDPLLLVAVTGVSDPGARARTGAAGFDLHLTKPADPAVMFFGLSNYARWLRARDPTS
jgi:CheY-like chemotaxis protein